MHKTAVALESRCTKSCSSANTAAPTYFRLTITLLRTLAESNGLQPLPNIDFSTSTERIDISAELEGK